jgi:FHS family L-fucose permease-like MFS transporter
VKRNLLILFLIFLVFFAISFLTNILGSINPNVSDSYQLTGTMTGLLPFSFFIAYALMSIPSGMFVQRYGEKRSLILAWALALCGAVLFSVIPIFPVFLVSLFMIGSGMALLQVALYPLLRVVGGEEHFAFNSVVAQLVFGAASFVSPFVYSYLVIHLADTANEQGVLLDVISFLTPVRLPWVSIYLVFSVVSLLMLIFILSTRFPKVIRKEDEIVGAWETHLQLFKQKTVVLFFLGIFAYVGTEQGIANWISEFLRTYHGLAPETEGARTVGLFWGMMTVGCFLGLGLLKILDSKVVLGIFSAAGSDHPCDGPFWSGPVCLVRFCSPGILPFGDVCHHFFPGAEQCSQIPWLFCRHSLYGHCRGCHFFPAHRETERPDRFAGGNGGSLPASFVYSKCKFLGAAHGKNATLSNKRGE